MAKEIPVLGRAREKLKTLSAKRPDEAQTTALKTFGLRAASAALLFISQIALARWMGAGEYGIFVTAWTTVLILGGISHLGLNTTMLRLVPEYFASGSHDSLRGLIRGGRIFAITSAIIVGLIGTFVLWTRDGASLSLTSPLVLAMVCVPIFALMDVQDGIGRGQGWAMEAIAPNYILRPLLLLILIGALHEASLPTNASTAMVVLLLSLLAAAAVQTFYIQRRIRETIPRGDMQFAPAKWIKISLPMLVFGVSDLAMQNADVLILNAFRAPEEIGVYYAAAKTTALALFIQYAIGSAYAGRIAAAGGLNDRERIESLVSEAVRWTFYPTAAIMVAILAVGYPVLAGFGDTFTGAYPLMFIMALGVLARSAVGPSEVVLNMLGLHRQCALSYVIGAIVCIGLNFALIPWLGVAGAATGTATALATVAALNWYAAKRHLGLNIFVLGNGRTQPGTLAPEPSLT